MQVDAHAERGRRAGTSDIQGVVITQLERTPTVRLIPEELCGAYPAGAFDACNLVDFSPNPGMARAVPGHRVSFAMSQCPPWATPKHEAITMVVSACVRPQPVPNHMPSHCPSHLIPTCLVILLLPSTTPATDLQEFGEEAPAPFQGTILVDYVDASGHADPGAEAPAERKERALLHQELLKSYIALRQLQGFRLVMLHAAAPDALISASYILRRRLKERNGRGESITREGAQNALLEWYCRMREDLERRGVAVQGGTLGGLAADRLAAEQFHIEGIPLVEQHTVQYAYQAIQSLEPTSGMPNKLARALLARAELRSLRRRVDAVTMPCM